MCDVLSVEILAPQWSQVGFFLVGTISLRSNIIDTIPNAGQVTHSHDSLRKKSRQPAGQGYTFSCFPSLRQWLTAFPRVNRKTVERVTPHLCEWLLCGRRIPALF